MSLPNDSDTSSESLASEISTPATRKNFNNLDQKKNPQPDCKLSFYEYTRNALGPKMSLFLTFLVALVALCCVVPQSVGFPHVGYPKAGIRSSFPDLLDASATELVEGLAHRRWTSVDLTRVRLVFRDSSKIEPTDRF